MAKTVLPTLAGFSVAAYAILFVVLDEKTREALKRPAERLAGKSPLLMLVSAITHAVLVQIFAIVWAIIVGAHSMPPIFRPEYLNDFIKIILSSIGLLSTIYGIILIAASVLSIFRLLHITTKT